MKKIVPLLAIAALLSGCATVSYQTATPLPGETLSVHQTLSKYEGTVDMPCRFRTALCPNQCDHGGKYAKFTIVEYTAYDLAGKYGDPKQTSFLVRVAHKDGSPDTATPEPLRRVIAELSAGQVVGIRPIYYSDLDNNGHANNAVYGKTITLLKILNSTLSICTKNTVNRK